MFHFSGWVITFMTKYVIYSKTKTCVSRLLHNTQYVVWRKCYRDHSLRCRQIFTIFDPYPPLCVQMDFMRTFQTNAKCNNINHVWNHFSKVLVVLKYHRRLWANIFDLPRCINRLNPYIKVVYLAFFGIVMLLQMSVS